MNETKVFKNIQKRNFQITVTSVVFVGMMMLLIPMLAEEANAVINGRATAPPGTTFSDLIGSMSDGMFTKRPTLTDGGTQVIWSTVGKGIFGSNENGWVIANVRQSGEVIDRVYFGFKNPIIGQNTCTPLADPGPLKVTCSIPPRGNTVTAIFEVTFRD